MLQTRNLFCVKLHGSLKSKKKLLFETIATTFYGYKRMAHFWLLFLWLKKTQLYIIIQYDNKLLKLKNKM